MRAYGRHRRFGARGRTEATSAEARRHDPGERLVRYVIREIDRDRVLTDVLGDVAVAALTAGREKLLGELACDRRLHEALRRQRTRRDADGSAGSPARPRPTRPTPRLTGAAVAIA